jgi:hypothetical protein
MGIYKNLVAKALLKATNIASKKTLSEGLIYPDGISERMHPELEEDLRLQRHSLGKHPAIPEGDESSFEQKIMGERFTEVVNRYKRAFDVDSIDKNVVRKEMMPMVHETMELESSHTKELEDLAIKMIRDEYDMSEDAVEIIAELTSEISLEGTSLNPKPMPVDGMEFNSHKDIQNANAEVYKRRLLNAMIQGAAKKCNHMFHMVDDELTAINPKLPNRYTKMMSAADYMYYIVPKLENAVSGGVVRVEFPSKDNPKAVIHAQAMVFPVLIHEIVKGVMELLSAHGLPKNKKLAEFVINKADFLAAEPWDMRLGPAIWSKFTENIEAEDFGLKHHVYSELAKLPAIEFHSQMREILAGTKEGKKIVNDILEGVKRDIKEEDFSNAIDEDDGFDNDYDYDSDIDRFL